MRMCFEAWSPFGNLGGRDLTPRGDQLAAVEYITWNDVFFVDFDQYDCIYSIRRKELRLN
jgi:hypothetical protein